MFSKYEKNAIFGIVKAQVLYDVYVYDCNRRDDDDDDDDSS